MVGREKKENVTQVKDYVVYSAVLFIVFFGAVVSLSVQAESDDLEALKQLYQRPTEIPYPASNPYSPAKEHLGKMLFFDPRLSASGTQSCATCHNPGLRWEDGMALGTGHGHQKLERATPTILNLAWDDLYFWDGRADSLEAQASMPIESEVEMNMTEEKLIAILAN
ncbi:MAG: cytochrome-c peroxidase, partial [Alphaproteobacteria bacterium]|nr:cytochrome-c peroxidase [Alphaproteobacteria bacterium]